MIGLTNLEVYKCIFIRIEENTIFELHKFLDSKSGGISYEKVGDEIEKDLEVSDFTANDLQDEIIGPIVNKEYRTEASKRMKNAKHKVILGFQIHSIIEDFENYLRTEIDLVEDDISLFLDEYNSSFYHLWIRTRYVHF